MNKLSTNFQDDRIIDLLKRGYAPKQIAHKLKYTASRIYHAMERRNLRIRDIKVGNFGKNSPV